MLLSVLLQIAAAGVGLSKLGVALGTSLTVIGTGIGIDKIGGSATEGIVCQPETPGDTRMNMIIVVVLVEGVALSALAVCLLALFL